MTIRLLVAVFVAAIILPLAVEAQTGGKYTFYSKSEKAERYRAMKENFNFEHADSSMLAARKLQKISTEMSFPEGMVDAITLIGNAWMNQKQYDSALVYYTESFQLAKLIRDTASILDNSFFLGRVYKARQEEDSMHHYYTLTQKLSPQVDENYLPAVYIDYANYYYDKMLFDSSLNYYFKALEIYSEKGDSVNKGTALTNMGMLYSQLGNNEKSLEFLHRARRILERTNSPLKLSNTLNTLGVSYKELDMYDSAYSAYMKSLRISAELNNMPDVAMAYFNIGNLEIKRNRYRAGKSAFLRSISICDSIGMEVGFTYNYSGLGELHMERGDYATSIEYYKKAIKYAEKFGLENIVLNLLNSLAESYEKQGNDKLALKVYKEYMVKKDSLTSKEVDKNTAVLQARIESEQKNKELLNQKILLDEKEDAIQRSEQNKKMLFLILGAVFAFLILTGFFYFRLKREHRIVKEKNTIIRQKNNELEDLHEFRTSMISTMVHDLKTPLNSIIGLSSLDADDENNKYIHQAGLNMLNLVSNILDVQRQKESGIDAAVEELDPAKIISQAFSELKTEMKLKEIQIERKLDEGRLLADGQLLKRVLVNIIGNAVKYSPKAGTIRINGQVVPEKASYCIYVTDNGPGVDHEYIDKIFEKYMQYKPKNFGMSYSTGIGLYFSKIAMDAMKGDVKIRNLNKGLEVCLCLELSGE